ncbi:unnamed protein product [Fusarium fujikuroi]|uniref:Uncharacterized protein n=1 Tax=Fusarium fujikuroi TaxID=5127 RepID=A0A9Q9RK78_FUSFU|nr:unnamed protein product [Fusarium fujikuroi]VZI07822.1 unnamed protein product [Fusarium fujikuroi]
MVTRYDTSEVRDTAFEMMHIQAVFDHRLDPGGLTRTAARVMARRQRRWLLLNTIADVLTHSFEKPGSHTAPTALHLWSHPLQPSVVKT